MLDLLLMVVLIIMGLLLMVVVLLDLLLLRMVVVDMLLMLVILMVAVRVLNLFLMVLVVVYLLLMKTVVVMDLLLLLMEVLVDLLLMVTGMLLMIVAVVLDLLPMIMVIMLYCGYYAILYVLVRAGVGAGPVAGGLFAADNGCGGFVINDGGVAVLATADDNDGIWAAVDGRRRDQPAFGDGILYYLVVLVTLLQSTSGNC